MRKRPTIQGRRQQPAGVVLVAIVVGLALGTLLNAGSLLKTAERQPLGATRSLAMGVMEPVAEVADLVQLDLPRDLMDRALGRAPAEPETGEEKPPTILQPVNTSTSTTSPTAGSSTTTTAAIPAGDLQTPTQDDPMFLWVIGDSFMELAGPALVNDSFDTGVVESEVDFRFISGLVRSDYFDWPAHIESRMPQLQPEAVVVMFGGNDGQPIWQDGREIQPDTPEWLEIYSELVGEAMDTILDGGAERVYWLGLPIMRNDEFTQRVIGFNEAYAAEAAERPRVTYVSLFDLFKDENGEYSTFLRDEGGGLQGMRSDDGAHFTWPGAYRLSGYVLGVVAEDFGFTDRL
jgi:hypothetical protein